MSTEQVYEEPQMEVIPHTDRYVAMAEAKSLEFMNPKRWKVMEAMATTFISSGAVPASIDNAAQMMMVFQAGYEAGMQPLEALNAFYIVNGKVTMYGDAVTSQIIKAGHVVEWDKNCDAKFAAVTITRGDNKKKMRGEFTIEMASEKGLLHYSNGNENKFWKKYPENMLKYKALGLIVDFIVPDALHGMPLKESIEASDELEVLPTTHSRAAKSSVVDSNQQVGADPEKPAESLPTLAEALKGKRLKVENNATNTN